MYFVLIVKRIRIIHYEMIIILVNAEEKAKLIDQNQQQHQVHPPNMDNQPRENQPQVRAVTPD
jgi:hypothetical protein